VAGGSAYYAVDADERFILAGRARVGSILGEDTKVLPASRRFYAGGGGSIRGYEYQLVGPLDDDEEPFGGTSLVELSGELRVRVTEEIGVVPFVDGGTVYDDPIPNGDETMRWAAGLGVRYFTGFGPVRLDVAFPLNPRDGVDEAFQFYISFGQAF
jgi:translocation and assembly module TamA